MEIDINFSLINYHTNVNVAGFHWKAYGQAMWYDTRMETRQEARKRLKDMVWEDILEDNPYLTGTEIKFCESGDIPVIDYSQQ